MSRNYKSQDIRSAGDELSLTSDWVENFDKNAQENKLIVSGGEAQRLALLRNFFNDQKSILILDEPTSALDEYTKKQAAFLIQKSVERVTL